MASHQVEFRIETLGAAEEVEVAHDLHHTVLPALEGGDDAGELVGAGFRGRRFVAGARCGGCRFGRWKSPSLRRPAPRRSRRRIAVMSAAVAALLRHRALAHHRTCATGRAAPGRRSPGCAARRQGVQVLRESSPS
jgi:ssDNA-binding Zn-finger/Zn-ribbon topoisomerase 1